MRQIDAVLRFVRQYGANRDAIIGALANGLATGEISWRSNSHKLTPHQYGVALYNNWVVRRGIGG
jgi:hypothetical protein